MVMGDATVGKSPEHPSSEYLQCVEESPIPELDLIRYLALHRCRSGAMIFNTIAASCLETSPEQQRRRRWRTGSLRGLWVPKFDNTPVVVGSATGTGRNRARGDDAAVGSDDIHVIQ